MEIIKELSDAFLILIRAGAIMRVVYSFVMMSSNEDEEKSYKKKIRNVIIFYILAELSYVIKDIMFDYYMWRCEYGKHKKIIYTKRFKT